uniref:WAP domain-containing protein n=1 Tax=Periophthalmus magnuspinnatus TaxID=409849 RepID=A0A3B4A9T2_9GOBI
MKCFNLIANLLHTLHSEKLGVCPKPRTDVDPTVVRCLSECSTDRQCEKNLKCCETGCGRLCTEPQRGNVTLRNTCGGCFFKYCSWFLRFV